jgi:hypothetical protein
MMVTRCNCSQIYDRRLDLQCKFFARLPVGPFEFEARLSSGLSFNHVSLAWNFYVRTSSPAGTLT